MAVVANCWHTTSKARLPEHLEDVVLLRGREGGQLVISSRRDIATTRSRTPAASRYTATDLELPSLRLMLETSLGHCCICESPERPDLDITDPVLFLDFVASHTCCVPEDPASLFIDRLAGKWPVKNFSPARARSAAACRGRPALELDARGNFSNFQPCPISRQIEALPLNRQGSQTFSAPLTSTLARDATGTTMLVRD